MKSLVGSLAIVIACAALAPGQISRTYSSGSPVPVPSSGTGGQAGGASNPANVATVIAGFHDAMVIDYVFVAVNLVHPRVGDVTMTLSHCGTSVTLFSGSSNQAASANGVYSFTDFTLTPFASAVNAAQGAVLPGYYKPAGSLSAFDGTNSAGPWILTVADLAAGVTGTVSLEVSIAAGANYGGGILPVINIPDGLNGNCVAPVTRVVNVPTSGQVGIVKASVGIHHPYTGDLMITVSHGGVTASILSYNDPPFPADLNGNYGFEDAAALSWSQAGSGLSQYDTIPPGTYRPMSSLTAFQGLDMAGPWYFTICDQGTADIGTLDGVYLTIAPAAWSLQILQPNGPASVTINNSGGRMGNEYLNLMTLVAGAFPNGWLYGIDMTFSAIASELALGPPFYGLLGPCGMASTTLPGPIPSGLTVYATSLELDGSGTPVAVVPGFAYTTP